MANDSFITYDMMQTPGYEVDECHYTTDNAIVYTYIHFRKRTSIHAVQHILSSIKTAAKIILTEVFGYESIVPSSCCAQFNEHIGLKVLVGHYQSNNPKFIPCTDGIQCVSRGILWKSDKISRITQMVHGRNKSLGQFFDTMVSELQEHSKKEVYDVVKKRQKIEDAAEVDADESCPQALRRLEDFESHVLHALNPINQFDTRAKHDELLGMEDELERRIREPSLAPRDPMVGGVYVAKSKSVSVPKIGATRRSFAERHTGLRVVPSPFRLIYWVPSATPFKIENAIHKHFDSARLREPGGNTEFFNVDLKSIGQYLKDTYPDVVDHFEDIEDEHH